MDKRQAAIQFKRFCDLYPAWEPNAAQREEWTAKMLSLSPLIAERASSLMYQAFPYQTPTLPAYLDSVKRAYAEPGMRVGRTEPKPPAAYIMCRTNPEHPNRVGHFDPIIFLLRSGESDPTGPALEQFCGTAAYRKGEMYGGQWVSLVGWTDKQCRDLRKKFRAEAGVAATVPSDRLARIFVKACEKMPQEPNA